MFYWNFIGFSGISLIICPTYTIKLFEEAIKVNNLRTARKAKNLTQQEVAEAINISQGSYSAWETGRTKIDARSLQQLAALLGVSTDYLLGNTTAPAGRIKIPVVGTVAAGLPCFAEDDILDYEEVTPEMAARGELFGLRVKGASMEPQIMDGDVVIVRRQDDAETGDTVVAKVNGDEATVKRLKKSPGLLTLVPANPTFDPLFFTPEQVLAMPVQIIGKVIELRRKF